MLFSTFLRDRFPCPFCDGILHTNSEKTINNYHNPGFFSIENLTTVVDAVMNEVEILDCSKCGAEIRYTLSEMERIARHVIKEDFIHGILRGDINHPPILKGIDSVMIYCGKCSGFNGRGACPEFIYTSCEIKRLPTC
jgi:hypothetical protein